MKKWPLLVSFVFVLLTLPLQVVGAQDTIPIAAIYGITGAAADASVESVKGVRLAVDSLNQSGGVLGRQVKLHLIDNQSTPIGAHIAAESAVATGAVGIVGAAWSSYSLAIAKVAQKRGIPMISSYSTHPQVTRIGDYIFRVCFVDTFVGQVMARFAYEDLHARTAVIFIDLTSDYSIGLSKIFIENFRKLGGTVLHEIAYKKKFLELNDQIRQAKKAAADVMFLSGHDESGYIVKKAQDAGITSIPMGGDGWSISTFLNKGGKDLKLGYFCSHWSPSVDSEISKMFLADHKTDLPPKVGTVLAYDATMLLADAIRRAGTTDRATVKNALKQTQNYQGVTGTITFNHQGDPVKSAVIMMVRDGKLEYLKTLEP